MSEHARVNLNTGESWRAGESLGELIEKQIDGASVYLHNADDRPIATWRDLDSRVVDLMLAFNVMLQVVQNQQLEIEQLQKTVRSHLSEVI